MTFADFFNPTAAIGGFVDIFDTGGNFIQNFAKMGQLNLPWGLALAPSDFGEFSQDILVGNLGDGQINAFGLDGDYKGSPEGAIFRTFLTEFVTIGARATRRRERPV